MITCPACLGTHSLSFYEALNVPVHQVKLVHTFEEAVSCPRGDIRLCFCRACGFIWNGAFKPDLMSYGEDYESTQAVSPTFNAFHERLARDLVHRFGMHGKRVVEMGCGQGEFVRLLVAMGAAEGFGFDTVVRKPGVNGDVCLIKDLYGECYCDLAPDLVICKMTLEHVHDPAVFLRTLRRTIGDRPDCVVVFMIPEVTRILRLRAFWDIYYEHCSYWSPGSLARAFRAAGFDPIAIWTEYDDQYVLIAARPGAGDSPPLASEESPITLEARVRRFEMKVHDEIAFWRGFCHDMHSAGHRAVVWGGGSKGVAFLNTLGGGTDTLEYAIDVNRRRHGTFIAGTGQEIVGPEFLAEYRPDAVVVMSPIYVPEILSDLDALDVGAAVISVPLTLAGIHRLGRSARLFTDC